jgi:hypothetical protein
MRRMAVPALARWLANPAVPLMATLRALREAATREADTSPRSHRHGKAKWTEIFLRPLFSDINEKDLTRAEN